MKYKNYYKVLGLRGPRASENDIKSAFRKLAKKYHPDQNPQYEEKFKDVNEAYQVLGTERTKKRYNIRYYLHFFQNGIDMQGFKDSIKNFGNTEFAKIFIGEYTDFEDRILSNHEIEAKITLEEAFFGTTKQIPVKSETGEEEIVSVKIPRGVTNGAKVLLKRDNEDLFIKLNVLESKQFKLEDNNLIKSVKITPSDAALGNEISVNSIDGIYKLKIPVGAQTNDVLSIKDAGFISKDGKRGELLAKLVIDVPKDLSNEERELYNKLKALQK
ncbi:MAG: J domain-containing protein [Clostridia bacterium]|nr:J domain-containing protein [Clostridia bacterium]